MLRLDQKTSITFPEIQDEIGTSLLDLFEGAIHIITRTPRPFKIRTPFVNASVEGTEFFVGLKENNTKIVVYEGKVSASNDFGSLLLSDHEAAITYKGQAPRKEIIIRPTDAVQWALYYPVILHYWQGDEDGGSALILKANQLLTVGQADEAKEIIQQVLLLEPNNSNAHALLAIIALVQNEKDQALELASKAVTLDQESAAGHLALSYAQQAHFKIEAALESVQKALILDTHNALILARLAELQMSMGYLERALDAAKLAVSLNSDLAKTQTVLGFAYLLQIDAQIAKEIFHRAIVLDQADPMPRLGLGLALIREGELEAGRIELEIAASLDPANSLIRSYLGKAYFEEKRYPLASTQFDFAKERDPKDPTPWFYDAVQKQTQNRPVEALRDIQKSIELNNNRAVYRSKMLLDRDLASRQASSGRIYHYLGFDDVANIHATRSLVLDPANYSAHRLLSDSYASKPRHEVARASQYLQSQLLQLINHNPIQPSLAYSDLNLIKGVGSYDAAFNEYNRLFERNGIRLAATGNYGSNNTLGNEVALSGVYNKLSFSLGQLYSNFRSDFGNSNSSREINIKNQLYNTFLQYEISNKINIQAEYRRRETEHNDIVFRGNILSSNSDFRRNIIHDIYRLGLNVSPTLNSNLLFSYIHSIRSENLQFTQDSSAFVKTYSHNYESQYLVRNEQLSLILGGGIYSNTNYWDSSTKSDISHLFSYLYSNFRLNDRILFTGGFSFDKYRDTDYYAPVYSEKLNPKLGFEWFLNKNISLRVASFRTTKSPIFNNQLLQPVQIARFVQFFDDINGTISWQNSIGVDATISRNIYTGFEIYKRDIEIPFLDKIIKPDETLYRLYFHWSPKNNWAVNSELRSEYFQSDGKQIVYPKLVETFHFPSEIRYFHANGFFASLKGTYVNQMCRINCNADVSIQNYENDRFNSDFFVFDTSIGFRFPKQYGLISLDVKNLFNENFEYRDRNYLLNATNNYLPEYLPGRLFFARVTLNY